MQKVENNLRKTCNLDLGRPCEHNTTYTLVCTHVCGIPCLLFIHRHALNGEYYKQPLIGLSCVEMEPEPPAVLEGHCPMEATPSSLLS